MKHIDIKFILFDSTLNAIKRQYIKKNLIRLTGFSSNLLYTKCKNTFHFPIQQWKWISEKLFKFKIYVNYLLILTG